MVDSSNMADTSDVRPVLREGTGHWVLDPAASSVEFHVKHLWGLTTVHGRFERIDGEGTVASDGSASGRLEIDATSLTTKHAKRDTHLRSADFFHVEQHPKVVLSARALAPAGPTSLRGQLSIEAAGQTQSFEATIDVLAATPGAVTLHSELEVDRTAYGMTWSPLKMAARQARGVVTARFVRQSPTGG